MKIEGEINSCVEVRIWEKRRGDCEKKMTQTF